MAELREHANRLREDNEHLRTRLEASQAEKSRGPPRPLPPSRPDKGKEVDVPNHIDLPADDELSSDSSPLPRRLPSPNAAEAQFRKRLTRRPSRSISTTQRRVRREASRDRRQSEPTHEYVPERPEGIAPPVPSMYPPFEVATASHMFFSSALQGPQHMLSSPLDQHILDYDPPRGFSISSFAMYDGSSDLYDHMLHFNQAMILNAGDDRLQCKVFPTILKGPTLAWFHKLLRGSINSFGELWAAFVSQYLCSVREIRNMGSLQAILKREDKSIQDFTRRFGKAVQHIDIYSMDAVLLNFRRSFGPTTSFFQSLSLDPPATMEELYRRENKFSTLEDNIRAASQTIMITTQSAKLATKGSSEQKSSQNKGQKSPKGQSEKRKEPPPPPPPPLCSLLSTSPMTDSYPLSGTFPISSGPHL